MKTVTTMGQAESRGEPSSTVTNAAVTGMAIMDAAVTDTAITNAAITNAAVTNMAVTDTAATCHNPPGDLWEHPEAVAPSGRPSG